MRLTSFLGRETPANAPSGTECRVQGEGRCLVATCHKTGDEASMALASRDWDGFTGWLQDTDI
ncbi:hypothetical protein PSCLAVI8L_130468 [Pseudoclavibacter sp. 8L]|nr:hypothetical protein PSCLAVI8L_130468 [Pseudoclavibacter sp. 8L]